MVKDVLARFMRLHPTEIDLSLDRMHRLLADLDHPERRLPPVIHMAGTNGKGSTLAVLRALFEAAEQSVHAYTSPHLVRFAERIRIAGHLLSDTDLRTVLETVEQRNADQSITFFEITTAAAFHAFAATPADVCLLETGLGGRLDATNVVDETKVAVLTPIALDHQDYLGETLTDIATEKAHILRPNGIGVVAAQPEEALAAITAHGKAIGATLWLYERDWSFTILDNGQIWVTAPDLTVTLPPMPLLGDHQAANAALAVVAAHASGLLQVDDDLVGQAIPVVHWPGRLQHLTKGAIVELVGQDIWLDGGHNPAAAAAIAPVLEALSHHKPVDMVLGMQTTKDPMGYLHHIAPHVRSILTVPVPDAPAPMAAKDLAVCARQAGCVTVQTFENWQDAVQESAGQAERTLLIAGSLYLVGDVLASNGVGAPD